jgi:pimeloyl-ACP methyl ester carboxylesterase
MFMPTHQRGLTTFLTADYEYQFRLIADPTIASDVRTWMGEAAFAEFMTHSPPMDHLSALPKNLIFAPGVMGSTLHSEGLGGVWWLDMMRAREYLNHLKLSDDGSCDSDPDAVVKPGAVDLAYVPFRKAIAVSQAFGGSEAFPYDWRRSFSHSVDLFRDKILEVSATQGTPVHLVGHSMGGLMIRATLMTHGEVLWPKVGKIVFVGTPHYGSPSIAGYLKNHLWGWEALGVLSMFLTRETFRSMRGVLSLLPAPQGIYPGTRDGQAHPCANFDMYDADAWKLDLDASATVRLQNVLNEVREFHSSLYQWHDSLLQEHKDRMLMIAGIGEDTLFRLEFDTAAWGLWERTVKVTQRIPCDPNREGDGRVPLSSALLEDVHTRFVRGEHGSLTNIPAVAREILAWLAERQLKLASSCAGALVDHLSSDDTPSAAPTLEGAERLGKYRSLPEYEHFTTEFRAKISADLDAGKIPQINLVKIL